MNYIISIFFSLSEERLERTRFSSLNFKLSLSTFSSTRIKKNVKCCYIVIKIIIKIRLK